VLIILDENINTVKKSTETLLKVRRGEVVLEVNTENFGVCYVSAPKCRMKL
jgi:hypothetical protein